MRSTVASSVLILAVIAVVGMAPANGLGRTRGSVDLVLHNGVVWTNDGRGTVAEAIALSDDRIVAVGSDAEVLRRAKRGARVVDLEGGTVLPGLRDQHTHLLQVAGGGAGAEAYQPVWEGYNPATSEAIRGVIAAYHLATKAQGQTPEDGCTRSPVTPELKDAVLTAQNEAAKQGLTSVVEAGLSDMGVLDALFELDDADLLTLRWLVRVGWGCLEEAAEQGLRTGAGSEFVKILGVKLYSDGWLGPRTSALREMYNDRPYDGVLFLDQRRANADVARARELGFNVTTHAIGDEGIQTMLNAYEANGVTRKDRYQLEHVQVLAPDIVARMARLGVIGSIQTSFATTDQRFAESALGPERVAESYAWRTMRRRGVRLAGGSDYNVEALAPLWGLQRVITRTEFDGTPPGGWLPDERLSRKAALRLITSDTAYASFEERERGRLTPGRYADLTVLREDLLTLPVDCIAAATVVMTVVNGRIAFDGAQAYPPGDATCPSGAAPATGG
jgi:predicted amidohydrolase YtcJ